MSFAVFPLSLSLIKKDLEGLYASVGIRSDPIGVSIRYKILQDRDIVALHKACGWQTLQLVTLEVHSR